MERNQNRYQNPFHNVKYQDSKPFIETVATPVFYNGYLIYHRVKSSRPDANVYDIVKDGVCVGMYAGSNGAKKAIDERALDREFEKRRDYGFHPKKKKKYFLIIKNEKHEIPTHSTAHGSRRSGERTNSGLT